MIQWLIFLILLAVLTYLIIATGVLCFGKSIPANMRRWIPLCETLLRLPPLRSGLEPLDMTFKGAGAVGEVGVTETQLRPVGKAWFGQVLVDVVTEGGIVEAGVRVRVIERRGNRVVVRTLI